jgi:LysR family transcriptional regulator, transcriptional activator of the cysJI operon
MICCSRLGLENLRLIRDVAHLRSVSGAAKASGISQSAASQQIQEVEREIGIPLFDRSTRPLTVTAAGKLYADYCRDVLRRKDEVLVSLARLKKETKGTVRLAAIYSIGLSDMAGIEERFRTCSPDSEIVVSYLRPERVYQAVERDEADLGLMSYGESSRDLIAIPWRDEEMVVAISPDHRFANFESVEPSELEGEHFVGFDAELPIQKHISRYLREHKVSLEQTLHFDNLHTIKQAVAHGSGIGIMPRRSMRDELEDGRLLAIRLQPPDLYRPVHIVHRRRKTFNDATRSLFDLLREEADA